MARKPTAAGEPQRPEAAPAGLVGLELLVFVGGAVVMALEIAGSRLLAPHFGNSVYVWGSLISVFLLALAGGYLAGGHVADRAPTFGNLNRICAAAAVLILLIPPMGHWFCRLLAGWGFGERSGPLVAASVLFLPASVLLGMLSPYAVRLAAQDVATIGRAAGRLYALSTLGSIAGTLVTTFVLIPYAGTTWIFRGLALALLVLPAAVLLARTRRPGPLAAAIVVAALGCALPVSAAAELGAGEKLVRELDTPYHHVIVTDTGEPRMRNLRFDQFLESSISLEPPYPTQSSYTNYFHLVFLAHPDPKRVLFIGAGGGIGPRTFLAVSPDVRVDVVDVDAGVLRVAHDLFHLDDNPRLRTVAEDGRMFLARGDDAYDAIILDAFTIGGRIPFHLTTREFFTRLASRLAPGGVMMMNTNSALDGPASPIYRAISATLQDVFPHVTAYAEALAELPDPTVPRNVLFLACRDESPIDPATLLARLPAYPARSTITHAMLRAMLADAVPVLPDRQGVAVFTDDHAPIETMRFQ